MLKYEMMLVLVPEWDHGNEKKNTEIVSTILPKTVKISDVSFWGKRSLAYPIRKIEEGVYLLIHFQAEGFRISDVQSKVKLNDDILRYLIIQEKENKKAKKAESKKNGKKVKTEDNGSE